MVSEMTPNVAKVESMIPIMKMKVVMSIKEPVYIKDKKTRIKIIVIPKPALHRVPIIIGE
jgi:hypothetical protein